MDPIRLSPISNTKSHLLIERSSSNTKLCLFLGIPHTHIQGSLPQAPHPIRLVEVHLFNQTKSV